MGNSCFRFQRFAIEQDRCAMKVGTDGVLLGAWAGVPGVPRPRILDVGTGTGLIALMMAQRFADAQVTAIDIDPAAASQAKANAEASPFAERVGVRCCRVQDFEATEGAFEAIVCNPPFYADALKCPDGQRTLARHTDSLPFKELAMSAARLLACGGRFSLILPTSARKTVEDEALFAGLMVTRVCLVQTKATKPPKRVLLELSNTAPAAVEETSLIIGGEAHGRLTREFLLPKNL